MKKHQNRVEPISLDNSAVIYPPTVARFNTNMFRLSMDLNIEVNPYRLTTALENIIKRFPYFALSLHNGFFWYYLSEHDGPLEVYKDIASPCRYLDRKKGAHGYLFKVFYREDRIAVEFFHAITDGTGGLTFLKSLVAEYLRLSGYEVGEDPMIFLPDEKVKEEELEDSFNRFYRPIKSVFNVESRAFHYSPKDQLQDELEVISAKFSVNELKLKAKEYNLSITEYVVCEILNAFQQLQEESVKDKKKWAPVRLSVPVNIRRVFNSSSLRNFTLFIVVGIDVRLGHYEFDEIVNAVMHQMRGGVNEKTLSLQISRNVAGRRLPFIRFAPNFLKNPILKLLSDSYGDNVYTSVISNLGDVSLPSGMKEVVKRVDFYLSPSKTNKIAISSIGAKGNIVMNITSILTHNTEFERMLCTSFVKKGVSVEVSTNRTNSEE
ncbi:MAG: hypothetical protein EOM67_02320 [Spirochaetia bacterium]|nr:hypothetical protein [Spirochaetia bacterium]